MNSASDLLAADTSMGAVTLNVGNLDAMTAYYRDGVSLEVLSESAHSVTLGRGAQAVMILVASPELKHADPNSAGLFHTAILYDSKRALAAAVYAIARRYPSSFTGSSDHLVSNAFYFDDPEGNGVELTWDRDRTQWSWIHGTPEMGTLRLDPNRFLQENLTEEVVDNPVDGGAVVGHVHLAIGDTETGREFYVNQLGFEVMAELPGSAVFVSAGRYHHHVGMNVWNSRGAGRRSRTLGLGQLDIVLPSSDEAGALTERMNHFGVETRDDGQTLSFEDPWSNLIRVTTR